MVAIKKQMGRIGWKQGATDTPIVADVVQRHTLLVEFSVASASDWPSVLHLVFEAAR